MNSIWAVARNTIAQALRLKIVVVFTILLIVLLPAMSVLTTGDGTLKGRLQTFVSYGLSLTNLLLCLLAIVASTYSVTSDITQKQIYTVLTKPIRRFQFLLGKLLGVILLTTGLLIIFASIVYGLTIYMPRLTGAAPAELSQVNDEFFTARAHLVPAVPDVTKEVHAAYKKLQQTNQLPHYRSQQQILSELTSQKQLEKRAAAVGNELIWEFYDVGPLEPNDTLFVRFKYDVSVAPPDSAVYGRWYVGDYRQVRFGSTRLQTPVYVLDRKDVIRTFHEIAVPADAIASDGYLAVVFHNVPLNNTVVVFPLEDGLEVLYKADSFTANYIRAVLLILVRLVFLTGLGVSAAAWLSFPVAILLCMVIFLTGSISAFIAESFEIAGLAWNVLYFFILRPLISLLPCFDRFNPTKFIVPATYLAWSVLVRAAVVMICIKAVVVYLVGVLIFSYREIARITA